MNLNNNLIVFARASSKFLRDSIFQKNKINKTGVIYMSALTIAQLESMTVKELYSLAREYKIANVSKLTKKELIFGILKSRSEQEGFSFMEGVLEIIQSEGYGFLRPINYSPSKEDIYIFGLKKLHAFSTSFLVTTLLSLHLILVST